MSRSRSMLHLATCERMMGRPGAVCSLSGVPTARGALASAFALAGLICVPGLMLVEIVGADGNLFACLALLAVVLAMVGAGIASCVRRIFDANRWGGVGTRSIVVANVAVSEQRCRPRPNSPDRDRTARRRRRSHARAHGTDGQRGGDSSVSVGWFHR